MLNFISEDHIEIAIEQIGQNNENIVIDFGAEHPVLSNYLLSDQFLSLNGEEKNLLLFCFLVLFQSIPKELRADFNFEEFEEAEEKNWTLFEDNQKLSWDEKTNLAFKDYKQEDLLAFVEDLLVDDESEEVQDISIIGKEFIFITAKSYIDCFV